MVGLVLQPKMSRIGCERRPGKSITPLGDQPAYRYTRMVGRGHTVALPIIFELNRGSPGTGRNLPFNQVSCPIGQ